jgi:hypothetical protein
MPWPDSRLPRCRSWTSSPPHRPPHERAARPAPSPVGLFRLLAASSVLLRPLAASCGLLRPVAASCGLLRPLAASCGWELRCADTARPCVRRVRARHVQEHAARRVTPRIKKCCYATACRYCDMFAAADALRPVPFEGSAFAAFSAEPPAVAHFAKPAMAGSTKPASPGARCCATRVRVAAAITGTGAVANRPSHKSLAWIACCRDLGAGTARLRSAWLGRLLSAAPSLEPDSAPPFSFHSDDEGRGLRLEHETRHLSPCLPSPHTILSASISPRMRCGLLNHWLNQPQTSSLPVIQSPTHTDLR